MLIHTLNPLWHRHVKASSPSTCLTCGQVRAPSSLRDSPAPGTGFQDRGDEKFA